MQNPTSDQRRRRRATEITRQDVDGPCVQWVSIEEPQQLVMLEEADRVLDSYFNPEFDTWETLILLRPGETEED